MSATRGKSGQDWQSRPCPVEFEVVFIEQGRLECEAWFRARRTTITRWLEERGKDRLLQARADFVRFQRRTRKPAKPKADCLVIRDRRKIDPALIELAIAFLQRRENGGWVVVPGDGGGFVVGTRRRSAADVLELAERKGFDKRRAMQQIKAFAEAI